MSEAAPGTPGTLISERSSCAGHLQSGQALESMFCDGGQGGVASSSKAKPSDGTEFFCPKCNTVCPIDKAVVKGSQVWCEEDSQSYNQLTVRWKSNTKLKKWWTGLEKLQQQDWFRKWKQMTPRARFQEISYVEKHEISIEDLEEEVEKFQTWKMFLRANPRKSEDDLKAEWIKIIEDNRSECCVRRGEWLVPEFQGIERRIRKRQAESQVVERVAHIKDHATLDIFWASGKQRLDMAKAAISPAVIDLTDYNVHAPGINSRAMDMPMRASSSGVLLEAMSREVSSFLFCSGRRFSISVENRIKKLFCPRGPKQKEK